MRDSGVSYGEQEVKITVQTCEPPIAEAGSDLNLMVKEENTFNGDGSTDSDGTIDL
jgi:hypothetical protein